MAQADDLPQLTHSLNRFPRFLTTVAFTTSSLGAALPATFSDGTTVGQGALYLFQPDADCKVDLVAVSAQGRTLTNTTGYTVLADQALPAEAFSGTNTPFLTLKGRTASGNMAVFVQDKV